MIRRSTGIAVAAIVASLILHLFGVSVTVRDAAEPQVRSRPTDTLDVGTSFEDLVESQLEPVVPEPAPTPESQPVEAPTSDARVASGTPQQTRTPDTAAGPSAPLQVTEPAEPEAGEAVGPASPQPSVETLETEPTTSDAPEAEAVEPPVQQPAAPVQSPTPSPQAAPAPERLAALPPVATVPPITAEPSPTPDAITVPLPDAEDPEQPDTVEPLPEVDANPPEELSEDGARAIRSSPRPPDVTRPEVEDPASETDLSTFSEGQVIESPLTAYRRSGTDLFAGSSSRSRSGGLGFSGSGGTGNASETNYAGQVLVQLNRAPTVAVSEKGWARVVFEISPDGTVAWVDTIDGTGSAAIESAAKQHIRTAAPFPPPPGGESRILNFVYQIRGR